MDVLAKKVDVKPLLAIFRYFPLLSVTSFPLAEGHDDHFSGQRYSREPLETFILSFTQLILALEPKTWISPQKNRFLLIFGPKNGQKHGHFPKNPLWKTAQKSSRKLFAPYVLFVCVPAYVERCR